MKWPSDLTFIRHGESAYNVLRAKKEADPLYQEFKQAFEKDHQDHMATHLARQVQAKFALGVSDYDTPLTKEGIRQATITGKVLSEIVACPDVVFVSPYLRTRNTFEHIVSEWPQLLDSKIIYDDRIREQEHGLSLLYNDWRVFQTIHREQKAYHKMMGPYWYQYPQGESVSEVRDRIRLFNDMLIRECAGKKVLVITHHLTILSFRANLERWSPEDFIHADEDNKPTNCGVTVYEGHPRVGTNGRLHLACYNKCFWK